MKKIFAIVSLAALIMPVSCTKEEFNGPKSSVPATSLMEFTALMETPASKTVIADDFQTVSWAEGDQIKFDYEIGKVDSDPVISEPLTSIEEDVAKFAAAVPKEFSMTAGEYKETLEDGATNSRHMYVSYPSTAATEYQYSSYTVTIPAEQDGTFANASIALAKWNPYAPKEPLQFKNLCGLLQIKVENDAVRQIHIESASIIAGDANVGFTESSDEDPLAPYIKNMLEDNTSKTITVNVNGAGTYYVAVVPGEIKDFYVELLDADTKALGDRLAKGDITIKRAQIKGLGVLGTGSFAAQGAFFVKANGTGDGSSWDNAANYDALRTKLTGSQTTNFVAYLAGGEYMVTAVANVSTAHGNFAIYGGYPSEATGYSLAGRDVAKYATVLKSNGEAHRIWNFAAGTYNIDGITMTGCTYSNVGSAFSIKKAAEVNCSNCIFTANTSSKYGGAVGFENLTSTGSHFVNCQFIGNAATGTDALGGAISANNTSTVATHGTVSFEQCLFEKNTSSAGGGAIAAEEVNYRFTDCTFKDNTDAKYKADDIYLCGENNISVYCDACNFYDTATDYFSTSGSGGSGAIIRNEAASVLALNNCMLSGPWGPSTSQVIAGHDSALNIIANSTLFSQAGYPAVFANKGNTHVLNSIVLNAAVSGSGRGVATNGKSHIHNSVLTKVDESGTVVSATTDKTTYVDNLIVKSHQGETFPVGPTWYGKSDGYAAMWGCNHATTTNVNDCRGKLYYYAWDGVYPEGSEFTNTTLAAVTALVKTADNGFATWLGERLGKDIRGNVRDAASMWPGSYQE